MTLVFGPAMRRISASVPTASKWPFSTATASARGFRGSMVRKVPPTRMMSASTGFGVMGASGGRPQPANMRIASGARHGFMPPYNSARGAVDRRHRVDPGAQDLDAADVL